MSLLRVAAPLASLFFFSAFALAQVSAPNCTLATYEWTYNSLGQSPCMVTAFMMSACNGSTYSLGAQLLPGQQYARPDGQGDSCSCTTVVYSLASACGACQTGDWVLWSEWRANCLKVLPPSSYPNPIPSGTSVPQWALIDVTNIDNWVPTESYDVGDFPEISPGTILGPSGVSVSVTPTSTFSSSASSSSTGSPAPPHAAGKGLNTAVIATSVSGGIVAICLVVSILFYLRRRSQAPSAVSAGVGASQLHIDKVLQPPSDKGTSALSSLSRLPKFHDPNDPTAFPGNQGAPRSQVAMSSHIGAGGTLANTQTSLSQARGYHGLPIV